MMPSTLQRRRAAYDFSQCYEDFCSSHGACPLAMVMSRSKDTEVVLSGERIRPTDWIPLCRALQMNKSLETVKIAFDSTREQMGKTRRGQSAPAGVKPGTAGYQVAASRMDRSAVTQLLCRSLGSFIRVSPAVTSLSLEGLWVRFDDITLLAKGLTKSSRLQSLSLAHCRIGDSGAEVLCTALQCTRSLHCLDLTACGLTWKAMPHLAKLVEQYANWRYAHLWQTSLRQVQASTDSVGGLRRITLNGNPLIGDRGVNLIMDTLQDDIWIKAVDMQHCGLSNIGVRLWLSLLRSGNLSLMIVDLRQNPLADKPLIRGVMEQIVINGHGINDDPELRWLSKVVSTSATTTQQEAVTSKAISARQRPASKPRPAERTTRRQQQRSRSADADRPWRQKPRSRSIPRHRTSSSATHRKRGKRQRTAGSNSADEDEVVKIEPVRGLPWRTAARCALRKRTNSAGAAPINLHFSPDESRSSASALSSNSGSNGGSLSDLTGDQRAAARHQPVALGDTFTAEPHHTPLLTSSPRHHRDAAESRRSLRTAAPELTGSRSSAISYDSTQHQERRHHQYDHSGKRQDTQPRRNRHSSRDTTAKQKRYDDESVGRPRYAAESDLRAHHSSHRPAPSTHMDTMDQRPVVTGFTEDRGLHHRLEAARSSALHAAPRHTQYDGTDPVADTSYGGTNEEEPLGTRNSSLAGLRAETSIDDQLLNRFESALNKFSRYLDMMKRRGQHA
eukprot:scpid43030/ scgid1015/ Centrosomal protein of 78 kDa